MGKLYNEEGERLEFVGRKETNVRGPVEEFEIKEGYMPVQVMAAHTVLDLMPEDVEPDEELVFDVQVTAHRPTGEFKDNRHLNQDE